MLFANGKWCLKWHRTLWGLQDVGIILHVYTLQNNNKNTNMTEIIQWGLCLLFTTKMHWLITLTYVAGFHFDTDLQSHWHVFSQSCRLWNWDMLCLEVNMKSMILKGLVLLININIIISKAEVLHLSSWKRKTLKAFLKCYVSLI